MREVAQQRGPVGLALDEEGPSPFRAAITQIGGHGAERGVGGEEREHAAAGDLGDIVDHLGRGAVVGIRGVPVTGAGEVGGDGQQALGGVVEGGADDGFGDVELDGLGVGEDLGGRVATQPQPPPQVAEVTVCGEGGRGEDRGLGVAEEVGGEGRSQFDGGSREDEVGGAPDPGGAAHLEPAHQRGTVGLAGKEAEAERAVDVLQPGP